MSRVCLRSDPDGVFMLRRAGVRDPALALRDTQLAVLEARRRTTGEGRPQDWAAFVVSGVPPR